MLTQDNATLTPKESFMLEYDERMNDKQIAYGTKIKELELEEMKLEAKWNTWLKIPIIIIKLPLLCIVGVLFGIAYIIHAVRGIEPSEKFWDIIRSQLLLK